MNDKAHELRERVMDDVRRKAERDLADTRYDFLRPRSRRRNLVLATAVILLVYGLSMHLDWPLVTLPALIAYGLCMWLLRMTVRGVLDYPDEVMDERIRDLRGYTYRYAFMGTVVLLSAYLVLYIANQLLAKAGWVGAMSAGELHSWSFVLLFSVIVLPSAIHAWVEEEV